MEGDEPPHTDSWEEFLAIIAMSQIKTVNVEYHEAPLWRAFGLPASYPLLSSDDTALQFCRKKGFLHSSFICGGKRMAHSVNSTARALFKDLPKTVQNAERLVFADGRKIDFLTPTRMRGLAGDCVVIEKSVCDKDICENGLLEMFSKARIGHGYVLFY